MKTRTSISHLPFAPPSPSDKTALPPLSSRLPKTPRWSLLVLVAIVLAYVATIVWLRPAANFGSLQDDALYFASAKAIASGQGFLLPSFPGRLTSLKCPELYPWLLSWVWRIHPRFPGNVALAIALTVLFGCWFLVACWLVGRKTLGLGPVWSLLLTAFCAFNFFVLFLGGSAMSDLPFAALVLSAALAADRSLEPGGHWGWMALAGVLAGLATGLRTLGVSVLAGIALAVLIRRDYRRLAIFSIAGGALALPWILPSIFHLFTTHGGATSAPLGWKQTVALYSNYLDLWRNSVPNWATQRTVFLKNLLSAVIEPGIFLLYPVASSSPILSVGLGSLLALASWLGILYERRRKGLGSLHGILLLYLAMILPYPFPPQRFMVLLLPLFVGGILVTARQIAASPTPSVRQRLPAVVSRVVLLIIAAPAAVNCAFVVPKTLARTMAEQRAFLAEERQAYRWIRQSTPPSAVFVAYNDVLLYLYTGRQAIRPIVCVTTGYYNNDPAYTLRDAAHLGDVARYVHAAYWLVSPRDFDVEVGDDQKVLVPREYALLARFPQLFRSERSDVRIYDLRCFQNPRAAGCETGPARHSRGKLLAPASAQ